MTDTKQWLKVMHGRVKFRFYRHDEVSRLLAIAEVAEAWLQNAEAPLGESSVEAWREVSDILVAILKGEKPNDLV